MNELDVRITAPDDLRAAADAMRAALLFNPTGVDDWAKWGHGWTDDHVSVSGWDGARCVGNSGSLSVTTKVPGGRWLPTAAITRVGVIPTHTRRGVLTRMMQLLLREERERGKALSSLRASEAVIYSRYGYGLAGEAVRVVIDPTRIVPIRGAATGTFRLEPRATLLDTVKAVYGRIDHRVGAITRGDFLWSRYFDTALDGTKAEHVVVHTSADGVDDGYAHYGVGWQESGHRETFGEMKVNEFFATSPAVELALWQFLAGVSLVRSIVSESRPVDDVLRLATNDIRAYDVQRRWDEQWVRLLDVEACLSARTYADGPDVTIAVEDPMFADNQATFRIGTAGVERVQGGGEITAPIATLSAAYFGSVRWADLAAAGHTTAQSADALDRADRLFAHRPGTWCGTFF